MISKFLRSACCDAPIVQGYEQETDLFPIRCRACWQELGAPGIEDVPNAALRRLGHLQFTQDMMMLRLQQRVVAAMATTRSLFHATGF